MILNVKTLQNQKEFWHEAGVNGIYWTENEIGINGKILKTKLSTEKSDIDRSKMPYTWILTKRTDGTEYWKPYLGVKILPKR